MIIHVNHSLTTKSQALPHKSVLRPKESNSLKFTWDSCNLFSGSNSRYKMCRLFFFFFNMCEALILVYKRKPSIGSWKAWKRVGGKVMGFWKYDVDFGKLDIRHRIVTEETAHGVRCSRCLGDNLVINQVPLKIALTFLATRSSELISPKCGNNNS